VIGLVGFIVFPTAPPRLSGLRLGDTVESNHIGINHGLVSSIYNPYAAVPSMHVAHALIVTRRSSGMEAGCAFSGSPTCRSFSSTSSRPGTISSTPQPVRSQQCSRPLPFDDYCCEVATASSSLYAAASPVSSLKGEECLLFTAGTGSSSVP
jgi:PAP2 superfamily protein